MLPGVHVPFVQPNKDAVITGKGWKFTVRAVFFFTLSHSYLFLNCHNSYFYSGMSVREQQRRSHVFVLALHTLIILIATRCTYPRLDMIRGLFCRWRCLNGCPVGKNWSLSLQKKRKKKPMTKKIRQANNKTWKLSNLKNLADDCERKRGKLWITFKLSIAALFLFAF